MHLIVECGFEVSAKVLSFSFSLLGEPDKYYLTGTNWSKTII